MFEYPFPRRLLFTKSFFIWLKNSNYDYGKILYKLILIKKKSLDHKDNHNLLIDFEYNNFDFLNENEAVVFKSAIKKIDTPDFLNKDLNLSDEEKIIKLSIYLTEEKPYKTYILTDNNLEKEIKTIYVYVCDKCKTEKEVEI